VSRAERDNKRGGEGAAQSSRSLLLGESSKLKLGKLPCEW